ncbi:MAG: NTP transferase domain-containing protein [Bacteroidota bacterium]
MSSVPQKPSTAVICVAGLGSRLGLDLPKCLVDFGRKKLIDYLLDLLTDFEEVRLVVGFKEEEVINYVRQIRKDVVFVRNPNFSTTTNSYSLYLGTSDLQQPYLTIDGDMIVDPESFKSFVDHCGGDQILLGTTRAKTDDAVFVEVDEEGLVQSFTREPISEWEWSGIAYFPANFKVRQEGEYVYQELEPYLPFKSKAVRCWEIDTPNDLNLAMQEVDFI